jgi:hypothetical protein
MKSVLVQMVANGVITDEQAAAIDAAAATETVDNNYTYSLESFTVLRSEGAGLSYRDAKRAVKEALTEAITEKRAEIKDLQERLKALTSFRKEEVLTVEAAEAEQNSTL